MQDAIFTVSELNLQAKHLLEQGFGVVQISGEISNWMKASSGHCYFSLKDERAQVRCACFRSNARLKFEPENGLSVILSAQVSLYPNRGEYQLIVSHMELAGQGQFAVQFEKLKKKLAAEGLFDIKQKKEIPALPKRIGIITSPTGAAFQDMKKVLARRFPLTPITLYPSLVQGNEAPESLYQALLQAQFDNRCDVILLARGGGSIEDLWAFNDEKLARLIAAFNIPIVTGIGHEIDFTIADFVADLRAPTPSAAAEMAVPDQQVFFDLLADSEKKLMRSIHHLIERKLTRVKQLQAQLIHPRQLLQNQMQRLDYAKSQLITAIEKLRVHRENELKMLATILDQRSPLKLLKRGYTVLRIGDKPICSIQQATTGDAVTAQLQDGVLELTVS